MLRFHAHFLSQERDSRRPKRSSKVVEVTLRGWFPRTAGSRDASDVCVHPEKERERMKCSLADLVRHSAEIENLGTLDPEELDRNPENGRLGGGTLGRHRKRSGSHLTPSSSRYRWFESSSLRQPVLHISDPSGRYAKPARLLAELNADRHQRIGNWLS
jgi:hypothetical protein